MTLLSLAAGDLTMTIDPASLGFTDTSALLQQPLPWIGQARAQTAARFGLLMEQPDYNLFVLGEVGSGRSSLLQQLMQTVAASRPVPPDPCRPTCVICTTLTRLTNRVPCACRRARGGCCAN